MTPKNTPELRVACPRCGAPPRRHCVTPSGRRSTNFHTARLHDAYVAGTTPEEREQRAHEQRVFDAQFDERNLVRLSFGFSCGCSQPAGEPVPLAEANTHGVARAHICDRHEEYAVVTRVTVRLVGDEDTLLRVLLAADVDPLTAENVAAEQCDENRAAVRAGDPKAVRYTIN